MHCPGPSGSARGYTLDHVSSRMDMNGELSRSEARPGTDAITMTSTTCEPSGVELQSIPTEVLIERVLSHMDRHELLSASLVCLAWKSVRKANLLWRPLVDREKGWAGKRSPPTSVEEGWWYAEYKRLHLAYQRFRNYPEKTAEGRASSLRPETLLTVLQREREMAAQGPGTGELGDGRYATYTRPQQQPRHATRPGAGEHY